MRWSGIGGAVVGDRWGGGRGSVVRWSGIGGAVVGDRWCGGRGSVVLWSGIGGALPAASKGVNTT